MYLLKTKMYDSREKNILLELESLESSELELLDELESESDSLSTLISVTGAGTFCSKIQQYLIYYITTIFNIL